MSKDISAKNINEAIGTLIAKICYRAADDIGDNFSEKTSQWRQKNALAILERANERLIHKDGHAHPRLVHQIIDEGSWNDGDLVQDMWAGLLASSCNEAGNDESNLLFINILKQLTSVEISILNHACEECDKSVTKAGWVQANELEIVLDGLIELTSVSDFHRLDRELDHLRSLELIVSGFNPYSTEADITPTALALQLYVRSQGYIGSPIDYFGIEKIDDGEVM